MSIDFSFWYSSIYTNFPYLISLTVLLFYISILLFQLISFLYILPHFLILVANFLASCPLSMILSTNTTPKVSICLTYVYLSIYLSVVVYEHYGMFCCNAADESTESLKRGGVTYNYLFVSFYLLTYLHIYLSIYLSISVYLLQYNKVMGYLSFFYITKKLL